MVHREESIKQDELKEGGVYRKRLLNSYAVDYKYKLVILNFPTNFVIDDSCNEYKVKQIIDKCLVQTPNNCRDSLQGDFEKIIIIEKVK